VQVFHLLLQVGLAVIGLESGLNPQWSLIRAAAATVKDIRTITLDLDDTLWEIHPVIRRAEQRLYSWLGENYPRITQMYEPLDLREVRTEVIADFADRSHDLTFLRRTMLGRVAVAAGYNTDFIDAAFDVFDAARNDVDIFPEVIPALEALNDNFVVIAVTNGNANLKSIGIDHLFRDVVTAAMAGAAKPARQVFDMAVKVGGASARQTLHVGDHPLYDIDGARDAGLRTVWVNRTASIWPDEFAAPEMEVAHVGELPRLLGVE
jgi:HAD superfamily hydrolase (TIGR01509 family)